MLPSLILCTGLLTLPAALAAQEKIAPPGSYAAVCSRILPLEDYIRELVEKGREGRATMREFSDFTDALWVLGFSPDTRRTVDADDLDALLTAAEHVALLPHEDTQAKVDAMWRALHSFAEKYHCDIRRS